MNPAKLLIAATIVIVHKIRRCEIGSGASASIIGESSLIAKHRFYSALKENSKQQQYFVQNFSN